MTDQVIVFAVPGRPVTWKRLADGRRRGGKRKTSTEVRNRKKLIGMLARAYAKRSGVTLPLTGPIHLVMVCTYRRPAKKPPDLPLEMWNAEKDTPALSSQDTDNVAKLVMDGLQEAGIYVNDNRITRLEVDKFYADIDPETGKQAPECTRIYVAELRGSLL